MILFSLLGTFVLAMLLLGALFALFWHLWPLATGITFAALTLFAIVSSLGRQIAVARILGQATEPHVGKDRDYVGRYLEHWEIPHILVLTGYRFCGLLPRYEKWLPEGFSDLPSVAQARGHAQHLLAFSGVVSEPGHFGHMGMASRTVRITNVSETHEWPNERSIFFGGGGQKRKDKAEQGVAPNT